MAKKVVTTKGLRRPCVECGKRTAAWHPILEIQVCRDCQSAHPHKYRLVTKTRALRDYRLRENELSTLENITKKNPHYSSAAPMQLFLLPQVEQLAKTKWGSTEPYIVTLSPFSDDVLAWLLEDLERLKELPPDKFQFLVADCFERRDFVVQIVGDVYRKDGGVDIVAYPKTLSVPFLLAVQAKHHRSNRKTPVRDVRDFHGVLASSNSPFHLGMLVTNTTFTPDAEWFAKNNSKLLRLRNLDDLRRWLQCDFANEHEWREIPDEIELAPGVRVPIHKEKLWLPE